MLKHKLVSIMAHRGNIKLGAQLHLDFPPSD